MDKNLMTPGMRVRYLLESIDATYVGPEPDGTMTGSNSWALIDRDDGKKGVGPNGEYAVPYTDLAPLSNLGSTTAATTPPSKAWGKASPDWKGSYQIGDRVNIIDECEGQVIGFDVRRKMIEVARDDDQDGSGHGYTSLKDGKVHQAWICSTDELQLLTSGTSIPSEGMPTPEPSSHKMGLDPETIDWSKFKKIRDML